jgi:hypothetical protein
MEASMTIKTTKQDAVIKLLQRRQGATVEQIQQVSNWQPHSVRAALTGLRKKGHGIARGTNAKGVTVYKIVEAVD